jgi:hypothetical protein
MLAYEVNAENVLNPDLYWTARRDGDTAYFPCPSCGGRNIVEEVRDAKGILRHAVTRFEKYPSVISVLLCGEPFRWMTWR